ncbi:hypothetical protein D3C73_1406460 [compost metagenome]
MERLCYWIGFHRMYILFLKLLKYLKNKLIEQRIDMKSLQDIRLTPLLNHRFYNIK